MVSSKLKEEEEIKRVVGVNLGAPQVYCRGVPMPLT